MSGAKERALEAIAEEDKEIGVIMTGRSSRQDGLKRKLCIIDVTKLNSI